MTRRPDPIEAMEQFLARIAPFDNPTSPPTTVVELRSGRFRGRFTLTDRAAAALASALANWTDPDDGGRCAHCRGHLGPDLRCRACGHLDGIFGAAVAAHAARVAGRPEPDGTG